MTQTLSNSSAKHTNRPWDFLVAMAIGLFLLLTVYLTWNHPWLTTTLLAIAVWTQLRYRPHPGDGIAMLTAALLGTPAEIYEVSVGEWTYHAPHLLWGIPIWIPLVWANLFALFRRFQRTILASFTTLNPNHRKNRFTTLTVIIGIYWTAAILLMNKIIFVIGLYAFFMVIVAAFWHQKEEQWLFLIGAVLGSVGEYISIQAGYWHYYNPYFSSGVDITLPLDWGLSAIIIHRITESLAKNLAKN